MNKGLLHNVKTVEVLEAFMGRHRFCWTQRFLMETIWRIVLADDQIDVIPCIIFLLLLYKD